MGIKQLMKLLDDEAPGSYKETERKNYLGQTIAIDASMQLYAMMVQIRSSAAGGPAQQLTNEAGEVTSHLQGFFHRTINLMSLGLRPVFVFDGKPPELKLEELKKRKATKTKAEEEAKLAEQKLEEGDKDAIAAIDKANKRSTRVTKEHNEDVIKLLHLMGVPVVMAPGEAEAQCAELCRSGKAFAAATEDMDALTFGTPILLRKLTLPEAAAKKNPVREVHLDKVLALLGLDMDQFVDLCILCGCDYCPNIRGVGPKSALKLIREHKTIEKATASLDKEKYQVPTEMMDNLDAIRALFKAPDVMDTKDLELKFGAVDEEGILKFLVEENQFDEVRVKRSLEKLAKSKTTTSQKRLDSFFKAKPGTAGAAKQVGFKRKTDDKKPKGAKRGRGGRR